MRSKYRQKKTITKTMSIKLNKPSTYTWEITSMQGKKQKKTMRSDNMAKWLELIETSSNKRMNNIECTNVDAAYKSNGLMISLSILLPHHRTPRLYFHSASIALSLLLCCSTFALSCVAFYYFTRFESPYELFN